MGANEEAELAKRRAMPATITGQKGKPMGMKSIVDAAKKGLQLVKDNPTALTKVSDYYKTATGKVLDVNLSATKGPAPAAVILQGLARAGIKADHIFDEVLLSEQGDAASRRIVSDFRATFNAVTAALDGKSAIHAGAGLSEALFKKEIILFAQRTYGSPAAIREGHAKMRAFLEMDTQALEETLALHLGR